MPEAAAAEIPKVMEKVFSILKRELRQKSISYILKR